MWNIKVLALTVQKLLARLKFQRGGQNDRMTELQNDRMTELQNDRMTDRTKTICPPIFDLGGIIKLLMIGCIFLRFHFENISLLYWCHHDDYILHDFGLCSALIPFELGWSSVPVIFNQLLEIGLESTKPKINCIPLVKINPLLLNDLFYK